MRTRHGAATQRIAAADLARGRALRQATAALPAVRRRAQHGAGDREKQMHGNESGGKSRWERGALVVMSAVAIGLMGCGGEQKVAQNSDQPLRVPVEQTATVAAMTGISTQSVDQGEVAVSADSLPPEVTVDVVDSVVEPGEAIEISALGSPDVREVTMSDGLGHTTSFVYDLQAKAWKAWYRVPMKRPGERLGLSVTAKNEGERWRRVWLFLQIADSPASAATPAAVQDTTR